MISGKPAQDAWSGLGLGEGWEENSKDLILSQPVEGMKPWSL